MEFSEFKTKVLTYCDKEKHSKELEKLVDLRHQFNEEFPIARLRTMSLAEYAIGTGSKDTFCYHIERGRYKGVGIGIGGANAVKFGIYFSKKHNTYCVRGNSMAPTVESNPDQFWAEFKAQLCDFLEEIQQTGELNYSLEEKYPKLKGMGMVLNKLCFLYRPDRFLNITNLPAEFALTVLGESGVTNIDRVRKSYVLFNLLRGKIPEISSRDYDPQLIGNSIYAIYDEYQSTHPSKRKIKSNSTETANTSSLEQDFIHGGKNEIYYGTPGCGKSHFVETKYGTSSDDFSISFRTVFHPDYTNSDFVGQITPSITEQGGINYIFVPGPFTRALCAAFKNPDLRVSLIIDEINRGNASAIFGDILQLLDRSSEGSSEYGIDNKMISDYLAREGVNDAEEEISLPSNLWIVGTMNTSDQNVFPLDTAFKRRWTLHKVRNSFKNVDSSLKNMYIPGSDVRWEDFVNKINQAIIRTSSFGLNAEDKQIGVYFENKDDLSDEPNSQDKEKIHAFGEKILMYIWEDVAKLDRAAWFGESILSLDDLLDKFEQIGLAVFSGIDFSKE